VTHPPRAFLALQGLAISALCSLAGGGEPTTVVRPRVLTLAMAIDEGLASDPRVAAEAETVKQAEADVRTASLPPNPSLSFSGTLIPFGSAFTSQSQGGPTQLDLELSYPLDWILFGKRGAAVTSAEAGVAEARAGRDDFVRQRRTEIATAFIDVLEARELAGLARQDSADLERIQDIAQQRVALGGAPPVEADRTAVAVVEARREARRREAALRIARATLAAVLGRSGKDADVDVEGDLAVTESRPAPDPAALLSEAEQARPDILARRRAVEKAMAEIKLAQRSAWPGLTSRAGYTRQYQEQLGFPDASSWGFGVDLTIPLFDRNQGGTARAASAQAQREMELRAALIALHAEIEQAASEYDTAREAVLAEDREQLEAAGRVRERLQKAYELGGRPLLEVLDAQRVYREASRQSVSGRAAFLRALHRLNGAVGREVVP
jgi:cobalt-zinc-cadmium efflux system outer membrane protein